ncbi:MULTISPECIES: M15 family metallopeptidase [Vibrio]|uniref:D-alanyl-D-alanine carboxypeptidase family protein n=1 Tax=Vibrio algicola TaxID=2662262 RepID=A0A5Q0TDZ1_9VIBR|nr:MULTISPECIES: M15 family metallopeptidase [Vibrio]MBD1575898.1 M15 family metallopeptidase [Vibrio sp. S11_S32]
MKYSLEQLTGLSQSHLESITVGQRQFLIHKEIKLALQGLIASAQGHGFDFSIASSFRDYQQQAVIWNNKFSGQRPILDNQSQPLDSSLLSALEKIHAIMRWSALPGASRHHWGCELDIYAHNCLPENTKLQLEPWEYQTGHQAEFSDWLQQALPQYGFYLPYQQELGGVAIEPWHISHGETSQMMQDQLTPDDLQQVWQQYPFLGLETVLKNQQTLYNQYIINVTPYQAP